jgi:hypothetical protein
MFVEQAIFTSLKTRRQEGYQLAATSPGVSAEVAKELAQWGPAHDSLVVNEIGNQSFNFHPLESGDYCVSRTIAAGDEYSGRAGPRIYTQMLIVPPALLERFANNPFAILEAADASGQMPVHELVPERLDPVRLLGRASLVNPWRLTEVLAEGGVNQLALFVHMAVQSPRLAVRSLGPLERLLQAFFYLLPLKQRLDFSFSTGLRFSARRPLRLLALSPDTSEQRNLARSTGAALLDYTLCDLPGIDDLQPGWAQLVRDLLRGGQVNLIADLLVRADHFFGFGLSLDEIARRVEEELRAEVR